MTQIETTPAGWTFTVGHKHQAGGADQIEGTYLSPLTGQYGHPVYEFGTARIPGSFSKPRSRRYADPAEAITAAILLAEAGRVGDLVVKPVASQKRQVTAAGEYAGWAWVHGWQVFERRQQSGRRVCNAAGGMGEKMACGTGRLYIA